MPNLTEREEKILARAFVHVERPAWLVVMLCCGTIGGVILVLPVLAILFSPEPTPESVLTDAAFGILQIAFFWVLYIYGTFAADAYSLLRKLSGVKPKQGR